ncbi:MAG: ATPase domain-containing protein [Candidatus Aenigmatarchaeota archaeon]
MIERVKTGIIGLDELIEGGFVKNSAILVTGKTGTGKTLFCGSFLYQGALEGETGLYITTEETEEDIINDIQFTFKKWKFREAVQKGLIHIVSIRPQLISLTEQDISKVLKIYLNSIIEKVDAAKRAYNISRLVIDSISMIEMFLKESYITRVGLSMLIDAIKKYDVTTIYTGTIEEGSEKLSGSGIVEFLVDAVIKLDYVPISEEFQRTLTVRKMRRTFHSSLIHPFKITDNGIVVYKIEELEKITKT